MRCAQPRSMALWKSEGWSESAASLVDGVLAHLRARIGQPLKPPRDFRWPDEVA